MGPVSLTDSTGLDNFFVRNIPVKRPEVPNEQSHKRILVPQALGEVVIMVPVLLCPKTRSKTFAGLP